MGHGPALRVFNSKTWLPTLPRPMSEKSRQQESRRVPGSTLRKPFFHHFRLARNALHAGSDAAEYFIGDGVGPFRQGVSADRGNGIVVEDRHLIAYVGG